jgi:hypothetical protein
MAAPRKIFRIEETAAAQLAHHPHDEGTPPGQHAEIIAALNALRTMMASPASPGAIADRSQELSGQRVDAAQLSRVNRELEAVTGGTAEATQKILAAAEEIDEIAKNLSAALRGKIEQGSARDISDLVINIYEACNFQDLIGQRVSKVMTTLNAIETALGRPAHDQRIAAPFSGAAEDEAARYLHGPKLDSDSGHLTQAQIDALFGG